MRIILSFLLVALLIIRGSPTYSQENWTAEQIVMETVRLAKINDELKKKHLKFEKLTTLQELDRGFNFKSNIKNNELSNHGPDIEEPPPRIDFNRILSSNRYEFNFADPKLKTLDGIKCYIIIIKPSPNPPEETDIYYIGANNMAGTLHIAVDGLHLLRFDGKLIREVSKFTATAKRFEISLIQERRPDLNNLIVVKHRELFYQIKIWIPHITRREIIEYVNYRYVP